MATIIFLTIVGIFLISVAISALRVRVMTELDEMDNFSESVELPGVAESGGNAVDGEQ